MSQSSQRVGGSRRPLHRIHVIHETVKEGTYPNCRKLAEMLEVTDKTIQRDISFMRDELGLPLEYDTHLHGPLPGDQDRFADGLAALKAFARGWQH